MRTFTKSRIAVAALACLAAGASVVQPAAAAPSAPASADNLFVATAGGGQLSAVAGRPGAYTLTLHTPAHQVTRFGDRPARTAGSQSLKSFVAGWDADGFGDVPPNAALVLDRAPASRDTFVLELSHPRIQRDGDLAFAATRIGRAPTGGLSAFARSADRGVPTRFGRASLFIDSAAAQLPVTLNVGNLPQGQAAVVTFDDPLDLQAGQTFHPTITTPNSFETIMTAFDVIMGGSTTADASGVAQVALSHVSGPITGNATIPAGATVSLSINGGPAISITAGQFSIG
jgi:hypothetical protein